MVNPEPFDGLLAEAGLSAKLSRGLSLLVQAHRYAEELDREAWDFAVEIPALHAAGLTTNDLRWLLCKGFLQHACEVAPATPHGRSFEPVKSLMLSSRTCFVLTARGLQLAQQITDGAFTIAAARMDSHRQVLDEPFAEAGVIPAAAMWGDLRHNPRGDRKDPQRLAPKWDHQRHEFFVGDDLVKVFRLPSPNQESILTAFEEDGWPARVDDPLPPAADIDPKRRLHDTIRGLNRNQRKRLITFMGDGTGEGIRWKLLK